MTSSPTARSMAYARKQGWVAAVVERWIPQAGIRKDLFGFIDLVVLRPGSRPVGVQACAGASHAARASKVRSAPLLGAWAASGGITEVWSWAKRGPRGGRKIWQLRVEEIKP